MKVIQRRIGGDLLAVPSSGYSQVIQRRTGGALLQAAPSSGYGHSSYNDGYHADHSDHYGSFSGHGSGCCPLVVDPLSYAALSSNLTESVLICVSSLPIPNLTVKATPPSCNAKFM